MMESPEIGMQQVESQMRIRMEELSAKLNDTHQAELAELRDEARRLRGSRVPPELRSRLVAAVVTGALVTGGWMLLDSLVGGPGWLFYAGVAVGLFVALRVARPSPAAAGAESSDRFPML
jgi:F0F1-type ATP synthase assembly protein I